MYSDPCARFMMSMMPNTSVRPAAIRKSISPNCTPFSSCSTTSVIWIPLMGWAAGTAPGYARALAGLQLALVHVHVLVAVEHFAHQLVGDTAFAVFFDDAQVVGLDGIVVLAVGELAPHRRIIGLGERLEDSLTIR